MLNEGILVRSVVTGPGLQVSSPAWAWLVPSPTRCSGASPGVWSREGTAEVKNGPDVRWFDCWMYL